MKVLQAKDILVLAGPSACGKSTLIRELLRDGPLAGQMLHQLGLPVEVRRGKLNLQRLVNAQAMQKKSRKNRVGLVVVQFDVLSCYRHQRAVEFEQVVRDARSVTVLTLCTPFDQWHQRIMARLGAASDSPKSLSSWCRQALNLGSGAWQPSWEVWRILVASRVSMALGHWLYAAQCRRWDAYWRRQKGVRQAYFDSRFQAFLPELPFSY